MNRAKLYLWSVLHSLEHVNDSVLIDVAGQAANDLSIGDPELRKSDMNAAIGAWAERSDLPDSGTYIANLRNEVRDHNLVRA
jgi:hypothetical protein